MHGSISKKTQPPTPFIKWDFLKSPLEKGDSGGCLVVIIQTLKFISIELRGKLSTAKQLAEVVRVELEKERK